MIQGTKLIGTVLILATSVFFVLAQALAQTPQETLNQYISDLQKNPSDYALRETIIKHVQTMKLKPALSSEAEKYEGRAEYAIKNAKNEADFLDAAKEYDKALLLAPWVSSYYFNQAIAYEKAGKPKEAKRSFEFYLLATPDAQDARDVRKRIAGLEYAAEKAAKESSPAAIAEKKQKEQEDFLRKINGARYIYRWYGRFGGKRDGYHTLDVQGDTITKGFCATRSSETDVEVPVGVWYSLKGEEEYKIEGRTLRHFVNFGGKYLPVEGETGVISDDGSTITITSTKWNEVNVYKRER